MKVHSTNLIVPGNILRIRAEFAILDGELEVCVVSIVEQAWFTRNDLVTFTLDCPTYDTLSFNHKYVPHDDLYSMIYRINS